MGVSENIDFICFFATIPNAAYFLVYALRTPPLDLQCLKI